MNAKIFDYSATIGRVDYAGWGWLCPTASSKYSAGNDSFGPIGHNSGKENGNRGEDDRSGAYNAKTKVQLCPRNEYRAGPWG